MRARRQLQITRRTYDFDSTLCKTVGDRVLCGYNKNVGTPESLVDDTTVSLPGGCRIRKGRVECGYRLIIVLKSNAVLIVLCSGFLYTFASGSQVTFLIVAVLWSESNGTPLFQGISFQRGFEINFKPLPRNPISFIKEKWSPFGVFGKKHIIQKRQAFDNLMATGAQGPPVVPLSVEPVRPAPVYERIEDPGLLQTPFLVTLPQSTVRPVIVSSPLPPPVSPILPQASPRPVLIPSSVSVPPSVIVTPIPPVISSVPPPAGIQEIIQIPPRRPINSDLPLLRPPLPAREGIPPISTNMIVPPSSGLFTDIMRVVPVVSGNLNSIQPSLGPPVVEGNVGRPIETNSIQPEPPRNGFSLNDSSLVRASRVALYFGSVFLQLMSQFMTNARATFDQMSSPPPVYNN
ncbi:uncharacterized protein LOC111361847 [Spodoptera litura]|uniref:Uncharacterized protein LOC111361847 n=1 Tax=Spodoptera litura TaxID=69820 RepID=A0A9J7ERV3_SPOLT|nr:uncharacterized protein LOC111361847 [Spodoptera litura]